MDLTEYRVEVAAALADACVGTNWNVYDLPHENVEPPCYVLLWGGAQLGLPWLVGPKTPCFYDANLDVRAISTRIEPDTGIEILERMVSAAVAHLDKKQHPVRAVSPPAAYLVNGVNFQSAV